MDALLEGVGLIEDTNLLGEDVFQHAFLGHAPQEKF